MSYYDEEITD